MDRINLTVNIEEQGSINITPVIETVNLKVTIEKNPVSGGGGIQLATAEEYAAFKKDMQLKIATLLPTKAVIGGEIEK